MDPSNICLLVAASVFPAPNSLIALVPLYVCPSGHCALQHLPLSGLGIPWSLPASFQYPRTDSWTTGSDLAADHLFSVLTLCALGSYFCPSLLSKQFVSLFLSKRFWRLTFTAISPPPLQTPRSPTFWAASFLLSGPPFLGLQSPLCHLLRSDTKEPNASHAFKVIVSPACPSLITPLLISSLARMLKILVQTCVSPTASLSLSAHISLTTPSSTSGSGSAKDDSV